MSKPTNPTNAETDAETDAEKKANSKSDTWAALAVIMLALAAVVLFLSQPG